MTNLRDIRRRLASLDNVRKITKTMKMIAGARLHHAQTKASQSKRYVKELKTILEEVLEKEKPPKKTTLIIITADRGHCGAYNSNVMAAADRFLKEGIELVLVGRKAIDHYENRSWPIRKKVFPWGGKITIQQVQELAEELKLDDVYLAYTQFVTLFRRSVVVEKQLDLVLKEKSVTNYILELSDNLLPLYRAARLQAVLDEAYAAELAARVISMATATKNAEDLIEKLTLVRNKVRQANITKEMSEIAV